MLLDASLQGRRVGTDNLTNLLAVLEDQESRHGADTELSSDVGELVDIDLVELGVGVLLAEGVDLGRDRLAGTAPVGVGVDDDDALRLLDLGHEVLLPVG